MDRFVSKSVLISKDGIAFDTEKELETQEDYAPRRHLEEINKADKRPLYQQLLEQKYIKEEEDEKRRKMLFAPSVLDEEEFEFIEDHQSGLVNRRAKEAEKEANELKKFGEDLYFLFLYIFFLFYVFSFFLFFFLSSDFTMLSLIINKTIYPFFSFSF